MITFPPGDPRRAIDIAVTSVAFALSVWLLFDTDGALRRIFFWSDRRASPRMLRFIWIDAALIALGTAYLLLSYALPRVWPG